MDRYEVLKVLGQGTFGSASLVKDKESGPGKRQFLVVKEINLRPLPEDARKKAEQEVEVLKSLSHCNIIAYHDAIQERECLHIMMEYANGGDLGGAITQKRELEQRFSEAEALSVVYQCLSALQHVHERHVLHRDIKSENIFLTMSGIVKLGDFGIACVLDKTGNLAQTMIGTPSYLSPEACDGEPYGTKADIWAMGVVFHEMLALALPFKAPNLAALVVRICNSEPAPLPEYYSAELGRLVQSMLQKDPKARPSCEELQNVPCVAECECLPIESPKKRSGGDGAFCLSPLGRAKDQRANKRSVKGRRLGRVHNQCKVGDLCSPAEISVKVTVNGWATAPAKEMLPEPEDEPEVEFLDEPTSDPKRETTGAETHNGGLTFLIQSWRNQRYVELSPIASSSLGQMRSFRKSSPTKLLTPPVPRKSKSFIASGTLRPGEQHKQLQAKLEAVQQHRKARRPSSSSANSEQSYSAMSDLTEYYSRRSSVTKMPPLPPIHVKPLRSPSTQEEAADFRGSYASEASSGRTSRTPSVNLSLPPCGRMPSGASSVGSGCGSRITPPSVLGSLSEPHAAFCGSFVVRDPSPLDRMLCRARA